MSSYKQTFTTQERIELALDNLSRARIENNVVPTYQQLAHDYEVPKATIWHRDHGRRPVTEFDEIKQYLNHGEEAALVNWYLNYQYIYINIKKIKANQNLGVWKCMILLSSAHCPFERNGNVFTE